MYRAFTRNEMRRFHSGLGLMRRQTRFSKARAAKVMTPDELLRQATTKTLGEITEELQHRNDVRFVQPNQRWLCEQLGVSESERELFQDSISSRVKVKNLMSAKYGRIKRYFTPHEFLSLPLDVGDVVDLSITFEMSELAVVVDLPVSLADPRYAVLTHKGELKFVRSSYVSSRIPRFFPREWFRDCVFSERDFIKDNDETLMTGSPRFKEEDTKQSSGVVDTAISKAVIQGNTETETYVVPSVLSGIVSYELSKLFTESWSLLPVMNVKLEQLHTAMQNSDSVSTVSIFQVLDAINITDLNKLSAAVSSDDQSVVVAGYKGLSKATAKKAFVGDHFDELAYGKVMGELQKDRKIYVDTFYSLILSLRKNSQLFLSDTARMIPLSVALVPLKTIVTLDSLVADMKQDAELFDLITAYMGQLLAEGASDEDFEVPDHYYDVIEMMRLYCGGSIMDERMESFIIRVIRALPRFGELDISRAMVYDILIKLGEVSGLDNPMNWWLLNPASSTKSEMEQEYYGEITFENLHEHTTEDRVKSIRKSFRSDLIFCIDAPDAHEIDDGISITRQDGKWEIATYVADPASYLAPDTPISEIAFSRSATLYSRDGTSVGLLPKALVETAQLGQSKDTRVAKFMFKYDPETRSADFVVGSNVEFGVAKRFVKISYEEVDNLLQGETSEDILNKLETFGVSLDEVKRDLMDLHSVSSELQAERYAQGALSNKWFDRINLERVEEVEDNIEIKVKPNNVQSPSQVLVSEIMISAGRICGHFMESNKIPAVFRAVPELPMSPNVSQAISGLKSGKITPTFSNISNLSNFVGRSSYSVAPLPHTGLGIPVYANCTSPLRRFCDILNHWQIQSHLLREADKPFTEENMMFAVLHLTSQEAVASRLDRRSSAFYMFKYLKHEYSDGGKTLAVKVIGMPSRDGTIPVMLRDYGIRAVLQESTGVDEDMEKKPLSSLNVGDEINHARIVGLDIIEGNLILESDMY